MRTRTPSLKVFHLLLAGAFIFNLISPSFAQEVDLNLPKPSQIKPISKPFAPAIIRAVTVNPKDPFLFDFIIDKGDSNLDAQAFEDETQKLVKYFLAALTIPENDLWVNLSPYEQDSMVPRVLGVTEMGKDLLIEDYYLKQVTASLTNPNTETGKKFWSLAYAKAQELYGTTKVPINTFSKVWIVPDQAVVLEKDGSAFIADSHLKVYLDQDYVAIKKNLDNKEIGTDKIGSDKAQDINGFSAQIIKEVVLPEIEKEVNTGENFASVRQIYSSAILAAWYKKRLKESLLGRLYADQNKVAGVNAEDMDSGDKIFEKYTAALKTGAYNIIKQDFDLSTQRIVQRKYFSGGVKMAVSPAITYESIDQKFASLTPAATVSALAFTKSVSEVAAKPASFEAGNYRYAKASVSLRPSAESVVKASSNAINRTAPTSGTIAALTPINLTEKDISVMSGLANMPDNEFDLLFSHADGASQNRGAFEAARAAMKAQPNLSFHEIANLQTVKTVLETTRTNPSVAKSVSTHAPQVPVAGFVALANATLNPDGSFNEDKYNSLVDNFNGSNGVTPISVSEKQSVQAALIAVQSSLNSTTSNSTTSGQQTPLTVVAESIQNPTVAAGLNVLSTNTNFAAQMQLNAADPATNTAVAQYAATMDAVRVVAPEQIGGSIAQSANVSAEDQQAITREIAQPNFTMMSIAQKMQQAPTLTGAIINNPDFSYAVSAAALAKTNPPAAIANPSTSDYFSGFLAMPDTEMQNRIESFFKGQGKSADQAQSEAQRFVATFSSLRKADISKGSLNNVDSLRLAASREKDKGKAADITAVADTLQAVGEAGKLRDVVGDYGPKTSADQQIRQAAGRSRSEFIAIVRYSYPALEQQASATYDVMQSVITSNPQALKDANEFGKALNRVIAANPKSGITTRDALQIISLAAAPSATRSSSALRTVDYIRNLFALDVDNSALTKSVVSALPDNRYNPGQKQDVATGLIALKEQAKVDKDFALQIGFAKTVDELKGIVRSSGNLNASQKAAFENLSDQDVKNVGGIDLSSERMDLKIKRDGNGVVLPVSDQDLKDLKIDGLAPVILNVQPATPASVPFLMNLANTAAQTK